MQFVAQHRAFQFQLFFHQRDPTVEFFERIDALLFIRRPRKIFAPTFNVIIDDRQRHVRIRIEPHPVMFERVLLPMIRRPQQTHAPALFGVKEIHCGADKTPIDADRLI